MVVHDCGRELNPLIVEGMVHGSTKPTAADVPTIEVDRLEHPSPVTPLGAKGVGEGGSIPGPAG